MDYEQWTNGQISTCNKKRVSWKVMQKISSVIPMISKRVIKSGSNHYYKKVGMTRAMSNNLDAM